ARGRAGRDDLCDTWAGGHGCTANSEAFARSLCVRPQQCRGTRMNVLELMQVGPVIPVIVLDDVADAVPLARALVKGGVRVLEVTLRTAAGLPSIRAIAREVPDAIVGVGTITQPEEFAASREAGAQFAVSPGLTPALIDVARRL